MKANELMIGDWVFSKSISAPAKIIAISPREGLGQKDGYTYILSANNKTLYVHAYSILPIAITPEILKKNFPTAGELAWWPVEDGLHCESHNTEDIMVSGVFRFVHQLQHCLNLAGIKKDIVL